MASIKAAEYAFGLCDAICRGMASPKSYDRTGKVCSGKMGAKQLQSVIASFRHWQKEKRRTSGPRATATLLRFGLVLAADWLVPQMRQPRLRSYQTKTASTTANAEIHQRVIRRKVTSTCTTYFSM